MGRRKLEADPAERSALAELIRTYQGNVTQMARALGEGVDRQGLATKLRLYKLEAAAAKAREKAAVPGPRAQAPAPDRARLLRVVARLGYRAAAHELGVSPRTMVRRMRAAGVTGAMIEAARKK